MARRPMHARITWTPVSCEAAAEYECASCHTLALRAYRLPTGAEVPPAEVLPCPRCGAWTHHTFRAQRPGGRTVTTTFMVSVSCDERRSPDCHDLVTCESDTPRRFDHFGTELFQQGWVRGFRQTSDAPDATSDTMVAYDVCPACMDERALEPVPHERQPG